jgi:hypothetical protein
LIAIAIRLLNLLAIYWQSVRQPIRPTLAVSLHIRDQCFAQLLDLDLDQLRRHKTADQTPIWVSRGQRTSRCFNLDLQYIE